MYDNTLPRVVIMELNESNLEIEADILELYGIDRLTIKPVISSYKGIKNAAWVINARDDSTLNKCLAVAEIARQESVLIVRSDRSAYLYFVKDGKEQELGQFRSVPLSIAITKEGYTYDPSTSTYYVAE